jgi:endonuclease/exonuclease/phosphatase family metal-dependent hydrolase
MAVSFRVASFNAENLFDRVKVFMKTDHEQGATILEHISALQVELDKSNYDKPEILRLYKLVKSYVEVIEVRGKLFNQSKTKVQAAGRNDWFGWLRTKRQQFSDTTISNTAQVLKDVDPDVACLIEVEDLPTLRRFASEKLVYTKQGKKQSFPRATLLDCKDPRGIDVGLLAKDPFAIGGVWSHVDEGVFSRDCLEVEVGLPGGQTLWVLLNHFKSKGYGTQAGNDAKRKKQATRVAEILTQDYDLKTDLVLVAGDLNDTPGSAPLKPLLDVANLTDVLAAKVPNAADRWTYHYKTNEQIDYILVSKPLALQGAGVFRRGIHKIDQFTTSSEKPYPSIQKWTDAASDHGAVWADFQL